MIAHNTVKARKTRSQVARLQKRIADLNATIAILQEDKEKFRSERDRLTSQLRKDQESRTEGVRKTKEYYKEYYDELTDLLGKARNERDGLKTVNGRLKDGIFYAAIFGCVAGLLLAPYIISL